MRAGRLRHRVVLQSATETRDTHGQPVRTWSDQAVVWAAVEPLRGKELLLAQQVAAESTVRVVMRHRADVTADWRVQHGTRTFEIESVINPDTRDRETQLLCRETV